MTLSPEEALGAVAELWRADVIELSLAPPDLAHAPPELPRTGALQRHRARAAIGTSDIVGGSLWHREWKLDAAENAALALMDGTVPAVHFEPEVMRKLVHKGFVAAGAASASDSPATARRSRG